MTAGDPLATAYAPYWAAIEAGDTGGALTVAEAALRDGAELVEVLDRLVAAAQVEVGRRWALGRWNVAQEHRATATSEEVVAALSPRTRGERPSAVVCCVDGEWHALPARLVAAVLREAGFDVHHLGASVPPAQLARYLHDVGPAVAGLSCSVATALPRARRMIEAARQAGVPVLVGGAGFGPGGRWGLALGADGAAPDARGALAVLDDPSWPSFTTPAPPLGTAEEVAWHLDDRRPDLVSAVSRVAGHVPDLDAAVVVGMVVSALLVGDAGLLRGFCEWQRQLLTAREVEPDLVDVALAAVEHALGDDAAAAAAVAALRREARGG